VPHIDLVGALRPRDAARYLGIGMETLRTSELTRTYLPGRGVHLSRAAMSLSFPARFMLAAAMNPCCCSA
jgi:hypothetical protein